ncbi:hypothetical protein CONLIGDRAFT_182731 [Coniochaeta ligniaria NRRL 30616]|uniref:Uncharacterized protein n=1 Tax=Coniochaeta ligniaria NRRL 30616 TaxID=1408157 RepID=A0A1J7J0G2_9PEZI|nr:hypothetical protein CONLIGDRAFT_182731 [Coniochaeta ligniaria NRRL 30616]
MLRKQRDGFTATLGGDDAGANMYKQKITATNCMIINIAFLPVHAILILDTQRRSSSRSNVYALHISTSSTSTKGLRFLRTKAKRENVKRRRQPRKSYSSNPQDGEWGIIFVAGAGRNKGIVPGYSLCIQGSCLYRLVKEKLVGDYQVVRLGIGVANERKRIAK